MAIELSRDAIEQAYNENCLNGFDRGEFVRLSTSLHQAAYFIMLKHEKIIQMACCITDSNGIFVDSPEHIRNDMNKENLELDLDHEIIDSLRILMKVLDDISLRYKLGKVKASSNK